MDVRCKAEEFDDDWRWVALGVMTKRVVRDAMRRLQPEHREGRSEDARGREEKERRENATQVAAGHMSELAGEERKDAQL